MIKPFYFYSKDQLLANGQNGINIILYSEYEYTSRLTKTDSVGAFPPINAY